MTTKLTVKNRATAGIRSIFTENEGLDESGISGLRNIFVLGWLFRARSTMNTKTERLIFLTPTVVTSSFKP